MRLGNSVIPMLFLASLFASFEGSADQSAKPAIGLENAWFRPHLSADADSICPSFLNGIQENFVSYEPWNTLFGNWRAQRSVSGMAPVDPQIFSIEPPGGSGFVRVIRLPGKVIYWWPVTIPGCGGACESSRYFFSDRPIPDSKFIYGRDSVDHAVGTPAAMDWNFFKNDKDEYFVIGIVDDPDPYAESGLPGRQPLLQVYRITDPDEWRLSCAVRLSPSSIDDTRRPELHDAYEAVRKFHEAIKGLMRGAGNCGTLRTHGRWAREVEDATLQLLYRPWAMQDRDDEYGIYENDLGNLVTWSLSGPSEQDALNRYTAAFDAAAIWLQRFYVAQFRMQPDSAAVVARRALEATASVGIRFYMYEPFDVPGEKELRQALQSHRPISEIAAISVDIAALERPGTDSILNAAIKYPEAMQFLLRKGANPNSANEFGKTPLMYAAQYDQVDALMLLLEQGADPDAGTILPADSCYYTIETSNMTALHYAARYASGVVIETLLAHDAATYAAAIGKNAGTPLDWLRKYTSAGAIERNSNIRPDEFDSLASLLRVPSPETLAILVSESLSKGRAAYASGRYENSYQAFRNALRIDHRNSIVQNDFSLAALRTGRLGESLASSTRVALSTESPKARAAALFNVGLACERYGREYLQYGYEYFCVGSLLEPYLESWRIEHTLARARKLDELFDRNEIDTCAMPSKSGNPVKVHFIALKSHSRLTFRKPQKKSTSSRIYVYHPASQAVVATDIRWTVKQQASGGSDAVALDVVPDLVERYELGDSAISMLESDYPLSYPISVGVGVCNE